MAFVRFLGLNGLTESGNGSTGWIYSTNANGDSFADSANINLAPATPGIATVTANGFPTLRPYVSLGLARSNGGSNEGNSGSFAIHFDNSNGHGYTVFDPDVNNFVTPNIDNTQLADPGDVLCVKRVDDRHFVASLSKDGGSTFIEIHAFTAVEAGTVYPFMGVSNGAFGVILTAPQLNPLLPPINGAGDVNFSTTNDGTGNSIATGSANVSFSTIGTGAGTVTISGAGVCYHSFVAAGTGFIGAAAQGTPGFAVYSAGRKFTVTKTI